MMDKLDVINLYVTEKLHTLREASPEVYWHCIRVANLALEMGCCTNATKRKCRELWITGALHDYGKLYVSGCVLEKPGQLTAFEHELIKSHSVIGYNVLLSEGRLSSACLLGILEHHERPDGSGYPLGVESISEYGAIIAAADVFDALVSDRVYKHGLTAQVSLGIMEEQHVCERKYLKVLESVVNCYHACSGSTPKRVYCSQ